MVWPLSYWLDIIKVGEKEKKEVSEKNAYNGSGENKKKTNKKPPTSNTLERKTIYKGYALFIMPSYKKVTALFYVDC